MGRQPSAAPIQKKLKIAKARKTSKDAKEKDSSKDAKARDHLNGTKAGIKIKQNGSKEKTKGVVNGGLPTSIRIKAKPKDPHASMEGGGKKKRRLTAPSGQELNRAPACTKVQAAAGGRGTAAQIKREQDDARTGTEVQAVGGSPSTGRKGHPKRTHACTVPPTPNQVTAHGGSERRAKKPRNGQISAPTFDSPGTIPAPLVEEVQMQGQGNARLPL